MKMNAKFQVGNEGTSLNCKSSGDGEPLIMIHGGCVDSEFWRDSAELLSDMFTVITYDRRGHSEDKLESYEYSIATQAADVAGVIEKVGQPCHIVAHSVGAVIGLELVSKHPDMLKKVLLFEPPIIECLHENDDFLTTIKVIREMVKRGEYNRALNRLLPLLGSQDERARHVSEEEQRKMAVYAKHFIKQEFEAAFFYTPDYEQLKNAEIYFATGDLSPEYNKKIAKALSEQLCCELVYYPGKHNCPFDLPKSFTYLTIGVIASKH